MEATYSPVDMYKFALWYNRKVYHGEFGRYSHPVNGKKDIETINDLIQIWKNETEKIRQEANSR